MAIELYDWMKTKARNLGKTAIKCTPLSFGSASISGEGGGYGFGPMSESDALNLIGHAVDLGVNLFDSAPVYGLREAEIRLGKFFKKHGGRDKVHFVSKSGVTWHDNKRINLTNDPDVAEKMFLQSLKDFQTDYIDIYFIHWPDAQIDIRRPLERLARLQEKGAIRYLGLCNTNEGDINLAKDVARIDILQSEYNLFNRGVENNIFPICREQNLGFMGWGAMDKGILSGSFDVNRQLHPSDNRVGTPWFKRKDVLRKVEIVDAIKKLGKDLGGKDFSIKDFVLGYYFSRPEVSTILCGSKTAAQWDDFGASLMRGTEFLEGQKLGPEATEEIKSEIFKLADTYLPQ
jgi:aryl-alcohol dehydrogenase-like predicted oxidoreductase